LGQGQEKDSLVAWYGTEAKNFPFVKINGWYSKARHDVWVAQAAHKHSACLFVACSPSGKNLDTERNK
jgi:hypothetical protein